MCASLCPLHSLRRCFPSVWEDSKKTWSLQRKTWNRWHLKITFFPRKHQPLMGSQGTLVGGCYGFNLKCLTQACVFRSWLPPCDPALQAVRSAADGSWLEKEGRRGQLSAITSEVSLPGPSNIGALRHILLLPLTVLAQDPCLAKMDCNPRNCEPHEPFLPKLLLSTIWSQQCKNNECWD